MSGSSPRYDYYPDLPEWTPDFAAQFAELRARLDASLALARTLDLALLLETFHHAFGRVAPLNGLTLEHNGQTYQVGEIKGQRVSARLKLEGEKLGDISLYCASGRPPETKLEEWLALLTSPLRNAYRYRDATASALKDPLTGTGSRVGLELALAREVALAQRHGHCVALMLLELDGLRDIGRKHGQSLADQALARVGRLLRALLRGTDLVFRSGDEQFAIVLGNTDEAAAKMIAERLRGAIAALSIDRAGLPLTLTASAGLACGEAGAAEIYLRADAALHAARNAGHNCVLRY